MQCNIICFIPPSTTTVEVLYEGRRKKKLKRFLTKKLAPPYLHTCTKNPSKISPLFVLVLFRATRRGGWAYAHTHTPRVIIDKVEDVLYVT